MMVMMKNMLMTTMAIDNDPDDNVDDGDDDHDRDFDDHDEKSDNF